jgi:hypothetical protein
MKILYIPLDERPCNYKYPNYLANITNGIDLLLPPKELMGWLKKPADTDAVWNWVYEHVRECSHAIVSIDTLTYGNIINSRIHNKSLEECINNISNLEKLKNINPHIEIHAFNLVTRVANYNSDEEDPDYWKSYGEMIWKYSYLKDKTIRNEITDYESNELSSIISEIPEPYLTDFLNRRKINVEVNLKSIELVKNGIIDYLVIPKDDCSEYGYAAMDQNLIAKKILEYRIMDRVMIYPGADEVGSVLFARIFNRLKGFIPKVYVRYSSTMGPFIVPKYEDRPLHESIKSQITSIGGILVQEEKEADCLLAVNVPGKEMIEASEQELRNVNNKSFSNKDEILSYLKYFNEIYSKPFGIADVVYANGADNELMIYANKLGLLEETSAYGGWNTAQNTIGVVLAQTSIAAYYSIHNEENFNSVAQKEFTLRKIIEDWLYQAQTLNELACLKDHFSNINLYNVGESTEYVTKLIFDLLSDKINNEFNGRFSQKKVTLENISLPWNRVFETDFDLKLVD